jgi:hypothetical protein
MHQIEALSEEAEINHRGTEALSSDQTADAARSGPVVEFSYNEALASGLFFFPLCLRASVVISDSYGC